MNPSQTQTNRKSGTTPAQEQQRFPPQIRYIIGNEACERFSYYGMIGILEVYLKDWM